MTILGTRPEIIKLSRIIHQLDKDFHHILVHTGQNYAHELNEIFVQEMQIKKPDYNLSVGSDRLADTIGKIISESDKIMEAENPDALFVLGDTNSCLSVIPAKRRKIPIFTWKLVTVVLMPVSPKRSTEGSWIIPAILI